MVILELIHAIELRPQGTSAFIRTKPISASRRCGLVTLNNAVDRFGLCTGDISFKCLPYQLSMVVYVPTMVVTGNGE